MEISTDEMRVNFKKVLQSLGRGLSLTLTYRNKPIGRIVPLEPTEAVPPDDPLYHLHESAEPMGKLTNKEMDRAIYGD